MRRFVAGAICPNCGEMDKLCVSVDREDRRRECVSCGYRDALPDDTAVTEPPTRVNRDIGRPPADDPGDAVQVLSFTVPTGAGRSKE